jgi:hypothetical protein
VKAATEAAQLLQTTYATEQANGKDLENNSELQWLIVLNNSRYQASGYAKPGRELSPCWRECVEVFPRRQLRKESLRHRFIFLRVRQTAMRLGCRLEWWLGRGSSGFWGSVRRRCG